MRQITTLLCTMLFMAMAFAQNNTINYKAIVKDGSGNIIANDLIVVQFEIREGSTTGSAVYQESHTPTTDANGLVILNIGEGTPLSGVFDDIEWSSDAHFLNVQINTGGGLVDMGTTEFNAVPYALMAKDVENTIWTKDGNDINYIDGNIGIGIATPNHPLHIVNNTTTVNPISIEAGTPPSARDILEIKVDAATSDTAQFIEMERGTAIVAQINTDGSAKFKSVQFEDNSVQTTAAIGPIAYGFVLSGGTTSSGSGNYTVNWNATANHYEITIFGESYFFSSYTTNVTSTTIAVDRVRTSSLGGKLLVYLTNTSGSLIQGNFQFITYK